MTSLQALLWHTTPTKPYQTAKGLPNNRELITSLNIVHKILLQVEQIRVSSTFAQPTLNALLVTVNSANECMVSFLTEHEKYADSLRDGGSGNTITETFRKVK